MLSQKTKRFRRSALFKLGLFLALVGALVYVQFAPHRPAPATPGGVLRVAAARLLDGVPRAGPDSFGYILVDSTQPDGPTYNFEDISGSGTALSLSDDQVSGALPIGFDFYYYGETYNQAYVSSNGFMTLLSGQGHGCCEGQALPDNAEPHGTIAGWWYDLNPSRGGTIYYQTLGTAPNRRFIVQFNNVSAYVGTLNTTFQFKLLEGSQEIEVHYAETFGSFSIEAAAGIENPDSAVGLTYYAGTDSLPPSTTVRYTPPLYLLKSVDDPRPAPGQTVTYTFRIGSPDLISDTHVVVSDTLPAELSFVGPVQLEPPQASASLAQNAGDLPNLASAFTVTAGSNITLTFPVQVKTDVVHGTVITNTASITSSAVLTPGISATSLTVTSPPDLGIVKVVTPTHAKPGDVITYTLAFSNSGLNTATDVVITDRMPVSITHSSLSYTHTGALITATGSISYTWTVQDLVAGDSGVITITGTLSDPLAIGTFINTATITTTADEATTINNNNSAAVTVQDDIAGVIVDPLTVTVSEDGITDTYTIVLQTQPTANVTVDVNPNGQVTVSPTSLTFTTANWNTARTVEVSAVYDGMPETTPHTGTIGHVATSSDPRYDGIAIDDATAMITDVNKVYMPLIVRD